MTGHASQIRVTSAAWKSVSDGHGGTLYAWPVNGGGNSVYVSFVFFDNARYVGQGGSADAFYDYYPMNPAKFGMKYRVRSKNDPMCCPSGPYEILIYQYNASKRAMVLVSPARQVPATKSQSPAPNTHAYTDRATGMTLSISKAIKDDKGSGYEHPRSGYLFVALYITFKNASGSNHSYNPFDLTLVDNRGQTFDPTALLPDAYNPSIHSGTMPLHQFRAGWTGFEIPKSTKYTDVYWDDGYRLDPPARVIRYNL